MSTLTLATELAWAAGFLDGEGSFGTYKESRGKRKPRFRIQAAQVHREPLDRLMSALGGNVRGPYGPYSANKQAYYQWSVWSDEAVKAVGLLGPYLCSIKSVEADESIRRRA